MISHKSAHRFSRTSRVIAASIVIAAPAGAAHAQDVSASVDLSANGGYATNPFLEGDDADDSNTDTGFVEGSIRPNLAVTDDRGRSDFAAYYRRTEYFRRYSASDAYGVSGRSERKLSEKIDVRALLAFDSSIIGAADPDGDLIDPSIPENPDIGLIGRRQRRNSMNASVGMTILPNARDTWMIDLDANKTVYPNDSTGVTDYVTYGGRFGYNHALSETSSVGATIGYTEIDYDGVGRDSRIISPQITYAVRFAGGWSINASAGVSLTRSKLLTGSQDSTSFSGQVDACKEASRTNFCLGASQATNASGVGDVRNETNVYMTYSYKLSERSSLATRVAYSRNSSDDRLISAKQEYLSGTLDYSHRLSEKLRMTAGVAYRDAYSRTLSPDADISGRVGIAYTLGDRR